MNSPRSGTVLVVTASMGAGHTEAAAQVARYLRADGHRVEIIDMLTLAPSGGRARAVYRAMLRFAPWSYALVMAWWAKAPRFWRALVWRLSPATRTALEELVAASRPDLVVSLYNLATQLLGESAARGRLAVPLATVITDPGAHPYWLHRQCARYVVALQRTAEDVRAAGAADVRIARPALRPEFGCPPSRAAARERLGLSMAAHVVVVSAGSWAAGPLRRAVRELSRLTGSSVIVLCGRNERIRRRVAAAGVTAVGWTRELVDYLAAADAVVDNAGGQTCWEALACGTPVVLYGPLPGHGVRNARTLASAGLAIYARTSAELLAAVRCAPRTGSTELWEGLPSVAGALHDLLPGREDHRAVA